MSNYYVHRNRGYDDELAHSLGGWIKRRAQGAHKYIAKIPVGGKMRCFYTQAELAAYKAGRTIKKGATAVRNGVTSGVSKASYAVRRAAGKAGTAVANATGYSAKQRADRLQAFANRQTVRAKNGKPGSMERVNAYGLKYTAEGAARKARKAYEISPLGKLEKTVKGIPGKARDARHKVTDAAGKVRNVAARTARRGANAVSGAAGKAREGVLDAGGKTVKALRGGADAVGKTAKRAGSAVSGAAGKAKSAASSAAGTVRKTARKAGTAVANATGYSEKQRAKRLESYANRSMKRYTDSFKPGTNIRDFHRRQVNAENALNAASQARKSYKKTAMGRAEGAARRAGSAVSEAAGRVSSAASNAVNTVKDWRKKKKRTNR